jgi:hypothetical protein
MVFGWSIDQMIAFGLMVAVATLLVYAFPLGASSSTSPVA